MAKSFKLLSGFEIPSVGLGTWKSKEGEVENAVKEAIKCGYRHIDCAFVYGNENEVGNALQECFMKKIVKREDLFVTSKLWNTCKHKKDVLPSLKKSLSLLKLNYLDNYLIHWPIAFQNGKGLFPKDDYGNLVYDEVDLNETWEAMEECVTAGFVKSIGLSNFNKRQIENIFNNSKIKPSILQIEVHAYFGQQNLVNFCKEKGIVVTAYSPLASPDRPWACDEEPILLKDELIIKLANRYGKSPGQILLRWLLQRNISVIPKSVTPSRIKENFNIFDFNISGDDILLINNIDRNFRYIVPMIVLDGKKVFRDALAPNFPFNDEF